MTTASGIEPMARAGVASVVEPVSTGIVGLDELLGGGLPAERLFLVEGDPGTGKTTVGLHFVRAGAERGERVLYITMSENDREIRDAARSHGWSLEGVKLHYHTQPDLLDAHQSMLHPAEVDLPETTKALLDVIESVKPQRLVIDSLSEFRVLARDMGWYRRQIQALKQYFTSRHCTVMMLDDRVAQPEDHHLHSIASGVIELEQQAPGFGPARRRLRIIKMRGINFSGGFHDLRIRTGGIEVFPRLVAAEFRGRYEPDLISSGVPELDSLFGGGIDQGTSTLLLGPAGAGKSVTATQYVHSAAARGEASVIYAFDERVQTYFERSKKLGLDLDPLVESGLLVVQQMDPAEMALGEFAHTLRQAVEQRDVKLVVIDSLSGYMHAMSQDENLVLHLHEMLSFLGQRGVTSLMLMTLHGLLGTTPTPAIDISYLADNVLLFRYFEYAAEMRQAVSVYKRRSGPHERTIRELCIDSDGIRVGPPLKNFQGIMTGTPRWIADPRSVDSGSDE